MTGRTGVAVWVAAGVAFAAYPILRPAGDTAADWASPAWTVAHLLAVAGFGLLVAGLAALGAMLRGGPGERIAHAATATAGAGAVLVLPYYGAEAFGLAVIGARAGTDGALATMADQVRFQPAAATTFAAGLVALAVAAVLAAVAIRRSGLLPRWTGVLLAAGFVLYLPQFFAPPELRVVHGLLVAAGCVAVGLGLRRAPVAPAADEPAVP